MARISLPISLLVNAFVWAAVGAAYLSGVTTDWLLLCAFLATAGIAVYSVYENKGSGRNDAATIAHQLEERYAQASFLAKVSHELRTPLHNIQGMIRILHQHNTKASNRQYIRVMYEASHRLLNTINDVLDYSKADTGMLEVELKETELDKLVRSALETVSPRAFEKPGLELLCTWEDSVPNHVVTDHNRVCQILINLIGNAVKFTKAGSVHLTVSSEEKENGKHLLVFSITDTGPGIPAGKIRSIFEPFNQVDMTVIRRTQGTGLGLTIVSQLVKLLKGEIDVSSELNTGSTFTVKIPVATYEPHDANAPQVTAINWREKQVAILGKSAKLVDSLSQTFKERGASVTVMSALAAPMDLTANYLVAIDDILETFAGWATLERFIKKHGEKSVQVLLSPLAIRLHERCTEAGISQVLSLPILTKDAPAVFEGTYTQERQDDLFFERTSTVRRLNVLIADDMPTNLLILRSALEDAGHNVIAVGDGHQLLEVIRVQIENFETISPADRLDVVLTDIQMPKMDGITAIQKARELEKSYGRPPLPMIAVTAHGFDTERNRILAAGADGILTKPLNPKDLESKLEGIDRRSITLQKETPEAPEATAVPTQDFVERLNHIIQQHGTITLDVAGVFNRSGDSAKRTRLILKSFLGCYSDVVAGLTYVEGTTTAVDLTHSTHALKGICAEVGATESWELAARMEQMAKKEELEPLLPLLPVLAEKAEDVASLIRVILEATSDMSNPPRPESQPAL